VRRKTEASGLEFDQVTVGAVEVERDTKEAETGGQEKRGSKQVGTEKGGGPKAYKTSSTTADREKEGWGGKKRWADAPCKISVECAASAASA